jgi:S1-C subfamily serine protease
MRHAKFALIASIVALACSWPSSSKEAPALAADRVSEHARVAPPTPGARIEDERNTIAVFGSAGPATVFVTQTQMVRDRLTMRALEVPAGSGSGFVWNKDGHIVTNYHVIDGAREGGLTVTLHDQTTYDAVVVGGEARKDIAVLKIDAPADELVPIALPPMGESLMVGQKTLAIGNPFGLDHTLTTGVISALGREVKGYGGVSILDMIQTDASINPGNSGGPLLDSSGQLIGMNTMIFSQSGSSAGIGFAVPVSTIRRVVPQIIETGRAEQVGMGVRIVPDHMARRWGVQGVVIETVVEGSPAAKAGIQGVTMVGRRASLGDVIVGIDDTEISNYDELYNALDGRSPGDEVRVTVSNDGAKSIKKLKLIALQ